VYSTYFFMNLDIHFCLRASLLGLRCEMSVGDEEGAMSSELCTLWGISVSKMDKLHDIRNMMDTSLS
jgi:hypothetical protein